MEPEEFVKEYHIKSLACCFSGGRSSLAMTHYVLSRLESIDIDKYVVLVDTGVMLPDAIEFAKNVAKKYEWNLHILRPKIDFTSYSKRYGTPSIKRRWCCHLLKLQPIFDFIKPLPPQRAEVIGFRADEVEKRQLKPQVWYRKQTKAWVYSPIITWTKKDVLNYIKQNNLPDPPWYKIGIKETCVCGAYSNKQRWMIIKAHYPELFQKFIEIEKVRQQYGRTAFYDKKPLSAHELAKQKTLDEF